VFTGLVRELGTVRSVDRGRLVLETTLAAEVGDSIAIDGVCLTVVESGEGTLAFEAVPETLARTALGELAPGGGVNLEPALRAGDPLGGHIVQGHVDGVATVALITPEGDGVRMRFGAGPELLRYVVEKGSIAVQGTSLTVAAVDDDGFEVALIPHTLEVTTLGSFEPGRRVNIEVDVLAKYVEKLVTR
jgi:riboflavin synthase